MGNDVELEPTQHNNMNSGEGSGSAMEDKEKHESDEKSQKEKDTNKNSVPFHKLFVFADKIDIFLMVAGTLGAMGNGLALPMLTVIFGSLVNAFGDNSKDTIQENVSSVCLNFVYLAMAAGAASFFQVSCWMCTGERQAARMRSMYLKTILRQDISYFDMETSTGEVIGTMSGDTTLIQEAMGEKIGTFLQLLTTFVSSLIIGFIKGWKLTLVLLSIIPLLMIVGAALAMVITKTSNKGQKAYSQAGNIAEQTIGAIRTVVSFCGEKKAANNYDKSLKPAYKAAVEQGLASGVGLGSFHFIMFCTYAMAIWYGSKLIINEGYSGGVVINIIFAVLTGGVSLGQTTPSLNAFAAGKAAAYKMFQTFERKPQIDSYSTEGIVMEDIEGDIELKDVHFRYPARLDVQIFSGFSLHIPKGTTTAIVGESGSGKSTVISLVERFYDPLSGEVLIDGLDIKKFQLKWIRGKIGLVSQEPILFATSILDNIAYGKEGATVDEIKRAAELANAAKFINKMPLGFDTMVGEHGAQLSGGQKQRIAIARAILKNPRILLLDEATSALDAESERIVQEALDRIMTNRTTIVVAHRLTTVRNADTIAVVQRGVIVEKGPHSQLIMNPHGAYSQLVSLQKMDEAKQDPPKISNIHEDDHIEIISSASHKWPSFKQSSLKVSSSKFSGSNHSSDIVGKDDKQGFGQQNNRSSRLSLISSRENEEDIENAKPTPQKDVSILRLALLNKPEVPVLILGSFAALVTGLAFPLFGLLLASVIKSFFKSAHQLRKDVSFWSLMFVILAVSQLLMAPLQGYCFAIAGGKLVQRVRSLTFKKIIYQEIGWFDDTENSSGAIVARLSTDAANVRSVVGDALSLLVQNIATVSAGLVIGFIASWKLSLVLLAIVPLFSLQGWVQIKVLKGFAENAKAKYEQASQVANEAVGSIRTVASFCAEDKVMGLYIKKCSGPLKSGTHKGLVSGVGFGFSNLSMFASYALLFWVGAKMVKSGETTFGDVFKVFFGIAMSAMAVSQTMGMAPDISKVKNSLNSVFDILDRKPKIDASDISGGTIDHVKGDIQLSHVSFKYPARPDVQIFRDLNISFPCSKTVALVGESGSGKSTVISLLQRFYDPDSGSILLDGIEITKLQVKWLRMQMGLVGQEPVLFNDTIRANIAYGKDGLVSEDEIMAATQASNVHKFISSLPQGYDTSVGERGVQLSGGQKQRIAIARAIVKDPKILLLDEATSALDAESERLVQDALDSVKVNRTTIVVAHRLSTIKDADMIAVVKNGVIAEQGKHDELLAIKDGAYATLVKLHMSSS